MSRPYLARSSTKWQPALRRYLLAVCDCIICDRIVCDCIICDCIICDCSVCYCIMPRAFVTGGTGFIGSHLAEELLRRGYSEVRCLVRSDPKWLKGMGVTLVKGDLSSVDVLWDALAGVDYVYHVAGVTRATDWDTFEQGNVRATLNLLGAVRAANPGVKKVLVTSTLAVVGQSSQCPATEETSLNPLSRYGKSKAQMERALWDRHEMTSSFGEELPLTVVRPSSVYGPREADIYTMIKTADSAGIFPTVGAGKKAALTLVHVRDLVRGMIDAAESEATTGKTYFLGSEAQYSWNEIKGAVSAAIGRRVLSIPVPAALVVPVGAAVEVAGRITGQYPPLNREKAREARYACAMCSSVKARQDFGYRQEITLTEGMAETVEWYRKEKWL